MKASYTKDHVVFSECTPKEKHILINLMQGNELKKGVRFVKTLWVLRELVKYFPSLREDTQFLKEGKALREQFDNTIAASPITIEGDRLRPYQRADVERLKKMDAAGIFNEPRTGKTPTTIVLMKELYAEVRNQRNLLVTPASLVWNWNKEMDEWFPDCKVFVLTGTPTQRTKIKQAYLNATGAKVLIVSKDTWKIEAENFRTYQFDFVAVDEAHYLRKYKTAQSMAVFKIKSHRRYALTGTPTVKHASDIHGILRFLNPKQHNSYWAFVDRYFEQSTNWMGHKDVEGVRPDRVQELEDLIALTSTQRKRKDVMPWLPEKQYSSFVLRMEGKQLKLYEEMRKYFASQDGSTTADAQNVLAQLLRLRQLCLDPRLLDFDVAGTKTEALLEFIENRPNQPLIIMTMFTSYIRLLLPMITKLGINVGMICGDQSKEKNDTDATLFQQGKLDILLCNIISAGTGFTLDRAETIIFTDKAWNPSENQQAEDRITPTTEAKNHKHEIISFTCLGSVEDRIEKMLQAKIDITNYVNNGGARALKRLLSSQI